jgi:recombination protein RecT
MNNQNQMTRTDQGRAVPAVQALRDDLNKMADQFRYALPAHIPPERFIRVVMTAVQNNPKLLRCTRQSFFNSCMKCAQDGLLPDGREAALVPYGETEDGQKGSDIAQYLPMILGIRKKVRNSGTLSDWNVQVVQEGDQFDYQLGDNPFIHHKPAPHGGRSRPVLFAYSIATFPDGTKSREVMNIDQIKDIQSKSKAKRGPWSDPIFFPEMARKTVARLHSKQLPMSTDLDTLMRRDDDLYDFKAARVPAKPAAPATRPSSITEALDSFGLDQVPAIEDEQPASAATKPPQGDDTVAAGDSGEQGRPTRAADAVDESAAPPAQRSEHGPAATDPIAVAYEAGKAAKAAGVQRRALPGELRDQAHTREALAWTAGWDGAPMPTFKDGEK